VDLRKELLSVSSEIAVIDDQITMVMSSVSAHTGNVSREEFDTYYQSTKEKISNLNGQLSLLQKQIDSQTEVVRNIDLAKKNMDVF
jgi:hypothetical protein